MEPLSVYIVNDNGNVMAESKYTPQKQLQLVETTLDLLYATEESEAHSQRSLARRLGVALGLTNSLIKRCVRKGLLKVHEAPARRFAYYLTPKGFHEKSRLTAEYLSSSLSFYRQARSQYATAMEYCQSRDWQHVALVGTGELAEIAVLAGMETDSAPAAVIDARYNDMHFCGVRVFRSLSEFTETAAVDAVIITSLTEPQGAFDLLCADFPAERILTPDVLRVIRRLPNDRKTGGVT